MEQTPLFAGAFREEVNSSATQAWKSIKALAKDAGVEVSQVNPQHAASEARLRKARSAKCLAKSQQLVAGHFCTMSGQPATVLSAIRPGVEGGYLADHDKAVEVLTASWAPLRPALRPP